MEPVTIPPPTQETRERVWPSAADAEFLSEEVLKDAAVELALQGADSEDGLAYIEAAYAVKERGVEGQYLPQVVQVESSLEKIRSRVGHEKALLEENRLRAERLRGERNTWSEKIQQLRFNVYITVQEIRKKRLQSEKKLFEAEEAKLRSDARESYEEAVKGLDTQIEVARKLYQLDRECWEINKPEYDRRVGELQKEKERVEGELNAVRHTVNHLRRLGVTRHTAGFLIWAGYASLAGVGGVVANLLSGRTRGGGTDYISLTFQYLTNIVKSLQTTSSWADFGRNVLWPSTFVLVILGLTGVLIWLADYFLKKFHKGWQEDDEDGLREGGRGRKKGRGRQAASENEGGRGRSPLLTPELNRLSIPLPDINRKSYVKLLALLPYLFLAFVIALLSINGAGQPAAGAAPPAAGAGAAGTSALSMTYIGVVFALLTVSVFVLYATKVIEPRWRKLSAMAERQGAGGGQDGPPARPPGFSLYLRAHWEFVVVVCAMILALLVAACLPTNNYREHAIWSAVAFFMCFSSMALAYGIIQRGIFRTEEFLDRKRDIYRRLIGKYSTEPTIVDVFELGDPDAVRGVSDRYRQSRQDLDELRLLYELKRQFADNYMDDRGLLAYWSSLKKWASPLSFLNGLPFKKFEPTEPDLLDYEIAPEETSAVNRYREEQLHVRKKVEELTAEMARVERDMAENRSGLRALEGEMSAQEKMLLELKQSYEQELARLRVEKQAHCLKFKAAYSVGARVAEFIGGW